MDSIETLREWFSFEKRDFPWRNSPTPYQVWVSEIMLQQTQASVVIPYFEKWMKIFPSIKALAESPLEVVIKTWEGLGYYSRARNLHMAANKVVTYHSGQLPGSFEELLKIPGIGPYTAGAILSFAFHQKAAAVDGNVARVISRLFSIEEEIGKSAVQNRIRTVVLDLLPEHEPWIVMEALIELGATICMKKPLCDQCPLQEDCLGFQKGKAERLPNRGKKTAIIQLSRFVPVIEHQGFYLIQKGEKGKVMADLYEFPYLEGKRTISIAKLEEKFGLQLVLSQKLKAVNHTFTHHLAHLYPALFSAKQRKEVASFSWFSKEELAQLPFSSGHRRILYQLLEGK